MYAKEDQMRTTLYSVFYKNDLQFAECDFENKLPSFIKKNAFL